MFAGLAGGIGLFLLGMHLLTEGLKLAAGRALEGLLVAWFSDGTTACSLTAEGLAQADFDALVDGLAAALASRAA